MRIPQSGWFVMENTTIKMDNLRIPRIPPFQEMPKYMNIPFQVSRNFGYSDQLLPEQVRPP